MDFDIRGTKEYESTLAEARRMVNKGVVVCQFRDESQRGSSTILPLLSELLVSDPDNEYDNVEAVFFSYVRQTHKFDEPSVMLIHKRENDAAVARGTAYYDDNGEFKWNYDKL